VNTLQQLFKEEGQSPWIDFIDRQLIESGRLDELIGQGLRGLTSNPTIFAKAVAGGHYDDLVRRMIDDGESDQAIYEEIAVGDVGEALDHLRPIYDESDGGDGFASIEVEPELADDTKGSLARARHLWSRLSRPNAFVKIPATEAGIPAIQAAITEGININITLMFSVEVYRRVAMAYIDGLRARLANGQDVHRVASVASFFVSRVDTKVDKRLEEVGSDAARNCLGTAAIANARLAYEAYLEIFHGPEFAELREAGAQVQRCLWASTSTKNPAYRDVLYVEELIGPETVDTMPLETIQAFLDHGNIRRRLDADLHEAYEQIRAIEAEGISMEQVTAELLAEGVVSFAKSFDDLIATIGSKREALAPA
jgi:transaldolase